MSDPTFDGRRPNRPALVATLPDPPYPAHAKARGWRFEIDTEQLFASSTWKLALNAGGDVANGLLRMWIESWMQIPAGSMPGDEREIAAIIGVPLMGLQSHRDVFFRHWQACNDGRIYHDTIGLQVVRLLETRQIDRKRKGDYRASKNQSVKPNVPSDSIGLRRTPSDSNGIQTPEPEPEPEVRPSEPKGSSGRKSNTNVKDTPTTPRKKAARGAPAPTVDTWNAYSTAYFQRYGTEPIRNASVNGRLANFVGLVGAAEAPGIAAFYVRSNRGLYVSAKHPTNLLLRDAEALRTEWATGRHGTDTRARQIDRTSTMGDAVRELIDEMDDKEKHGHKPEG